MSIWVHVKLRGIFFVWIKIIKLKFILIKHVIYRSRLLLLLWFIIIIIIDYKNFWEVSICDYLTFECLYPWFERKKGWTKSDFVIRTYGASFETFASFSRKYGDNETYITLSFMHLEKLLIIRLLSGSCCTVGWKDVLLCTLYGKDIYWRLPSDVMWCDVMWCSDLQYVNNLQTFRNEHYRQHVRMLCFKLLYSKVSRPTCEKVFELQYFSMRCQTFNLDTSKITVIFYIQIYLNILPFLEWYDQNI
jgi:hypothetical protein